MKTYSDYLAQIFPGIKVQKISIDAGFTCPNRDGTLSTGGCIYCRNDSFSPGYCNPSLSIKNQIEEGKKFFSRKYPDMKYLAYFQSYTGTYNKGTEELKEMYMEALDQEDVIGLVVATRPDCLPDSTLNLLNDINKNYKPVFIEIGAETSHNDTLKLINRNHTWEDVEETVRRIADKGIHCGLHLIIGLPEETNEMIFDTIRKTSRLPIETIKLHQLQVLKDTHLYHKLQTHQLQIPDFTLEEYLELCSRIVKMMPNEIIIERFLSQSPPEMVVTPSWGLKNYEFMTKLAKLL